MSIEAAGVYALGERRPQTEGDDFYIAPGARVIGSVRLGAGASVWFNCVLRADDERIDIGAGSNVQDGVVMHADPGIPTQVGCDVTIGHGALLHGCVIADQCLIGIGAIVLDRAHIARGCIVAAGTLVPPGKRFPERCVIMGAPARVVREVTAEDLERIAASAAHYRARMRRYREALVPLTP